MAVGMAEVYNPACCSLLHVVAMEHFRLEESMYIAHASPKSGDVFQTALPVNRRRFARSILEHGG